MQSLKVTDISGFLDPVARPWNGIAAERVDMMPSPLGLQPNDYIIASWEERPYGELEVLSAASVHDGQRIAVRLVWEKDKPSAGAGEGFPDAAAIAFPVRGDPLLMQMGSADAPIHALQWRARGNETRSVNAEGIGSSKPGPDVAAAGKGGWSGGNWHVVMTRNLAVPQGGAVLVSGHATRIGFAVWNGHNEERAGIKAVSLDWIDLELEA